MSSSEIPKEIPPRKAVEQRGRPLRRQPTGVPEPTVPTGSRPKKSAASRKLRKDRSMRIPAIENDMMNRIGISRKRKAMARAASTKASRSSSPYKSLLSGIARTEDVPHATSDAEGSSSSSDGGSSSSIVRCASPSPLAESSTSPSPPPQPSKQLARPAATVTGAAEAKDKTKRITPQSSVVLRPLPSRVTASSPHRAAGGSPAGYPLSRTPLDARTAPKARPSGTRPPGVPPSPRPGSISSRRRSTRARPGDSPPDKRKIHSVPAPVASAVSDKPTAKPAKLQASIARGEESDSQSENLSLSDATSHGGSSVPNVSAANVAQAAAIKQSLLSQIEERNEGKKWDDLLGFFHGLAPGEISGLLKTATQAGRRALRRLAGKEVADSDNNKGEDDDARVPERARQPRRQAESVLASDDAGSSGEGEVTTQTIEPSRRKRFLYGAKGRARTRSPSPLLPSPPPPLFVSQTADAASSSSASNCLSAPSAARKRARTPESASDDDDDATSEPPAKRRKWNGPRPLLREGAFYEYPAAPPPLPIPAQRDDDIHQNDEDDDEEEKEEEPPTVHVNLIQSFLDQVQDLDVAGWLTRGHPSDSKVADDDDDGLFERGSSRIPHDAELQGYARRRQRRHRRGRGSVRADDEHKAMTRRTALGCTSPRVVSRT